MKAAFLVLAFFVFQWGTGIYNNMVKKQEGVNAAWSQVENVYQRRLDLIPNLVETVKGVANFEKETYTAVAEARSKAGQVTLGPETINDPAAFERFQQTQGELSSALSRLLVAVERYPELKANQNFLELQSQLDIRLEAADFERIITVGNLLDLVQERLKAVKKAA